MSVQTDAYAVLLPAISDLTLTEPLRRFLGEGGQSLLLGEDRAEYLARRMSAARQATETADMIADATEQVRGLAGRALIAVDQEPAGICRLHALVPQLPERPALHRMHAPQIRQAGFDMARAAAAMGVNMLLSPVLDVVTGGNPWLQGRHLGPDGAEVARIASAWIAGVEAAGVIATAKHFPGHHDIDGDPAIEIATVGGARPGLEPGLVPFRQAIAAQVRAIMTGPALVPAMDPLMPSSLSALTIHFLRRDLGFAGLVVSDDLDAAGTLRGQRDVPQAAVQALVAGADLLLLSAENDLAAVRDRIAAAVADGTLDPQRLAEAAGRVRGLAG